jgi:cell wall-associated NlpC family hydrolase
VQQPRTVRRRPRAVALLGVLATVAGVLLAPGQAAAKPPPNPSDGQISAVQQHKLNLAVEVGRLAAQTAQMQSRLQRLKAEQELAEQKLAFALSKLAEAKTAAGKARATVARAKANVAQAQANFVGYLQASYMSGDAGGTTGTLLTAHDPNVLLESGALHDYQSSHQLSAIGNLQRATVAKSNADAAARAAVSRQAELTHAADVAKDQAVAAVNSAKRQEQQLEQALAANQGQLQRAQMELATLNNQRATFVAYQREQARIAAAQAAAEERRRQEAIAAGAIAAAAGNSGGGGGGGGGDGGVYVSPGPRGNWTAATGQQAVNRAMTRLGAPYIWAGGDASGPTTGGCTDPVAPCGVLGFDCSGLAMYAWAQYPFVHLASAQYLQGSVHPNTSSLMAGDLVFWSSNGSINGIHHVAIYIGGGNVIQAPQSGDIVRVTPLSQVDFGYFGATRPMT